MRKLSSEIHLDLDCECYLKFFNAYSDYGLQIEPFYRYHESKYDEANDFILFS